MNFKKFLSTTFGILMFTTIVSTLGTPVKAGLDDDIDIERITQEVRRNSFSSPVYVTATASDQLSYIWNSIDEHLPMIKDLAAIDSETALRELSSTVSKRTSEAMAMHGDTAASFLHLYFIHNYNITTPEKQNRSGKGVWFLAHNSEDPYDLIRQFNELDSDSNFHLVGPYLDLNILGEDSFFCALLSKFQNRDFAIL